MKRLYENIEDINIRGGIDQLSEVVRTIDKSLQNIANNTDQLVEYLAKYSNSNKGAQYENVIRTSMYLRDELFDAALELNDMQKQIVAYQNKIYRYEDMAESAQQPNPYLITKRQISVENSITHFNQSDMMEVVEILKNYSERVSHHIKMIEENKNSIAAVWRDTQYDDFAEFIDEVTGKINDAIKLFEEYVNYLEEKIKELS